MRGDIQEAQESLLPWRRGRVDADTRLGGRLDLAAERLCGPGPDGAGRRRRRHFRARAQRAAGREGRRPQLPGHVQCAGLPAGVDAPDERDHLHDAFVPAGCAGRVEPQPAVTVGAGAIWMHVYDAVTTKGGPLRSGRRMRHRGGGRADAERRVRELFEALRTGGGQPARGRDRHRRRRGANRQRLHESGPLLGDQGRRRGQLWRRDPAHPPHARAA